MGLQVGDGAVAQKQETKVPLFQRGQDLRHIRIQPGPAALDQLQHPAADEGAGGPLFLRGQVWHKAVPHILRSQADPLPHFIGAPASRLRAAQLRQAVIGRLEGRGVNLQAVVEGAVVVKEEVDHSYASSARMRFTISMAPWAHSEPLLPALEPARSMACSMVSVVSTPNMTGISLFRDTLATPLETSLHT